MNALIYVDIDHKYKEAWNEKRKKQLWFFVYKKWQISKRFNGTFHQAQTLKLGGVSGAQILKVTSEHSYVSEWQIISVIFMASSVCDFHNSPPAY